MKGEKAQIEKSTEEMSPLWKNNAREENKDLRNRGGK